MYILKNSLFLTVILIIATMEWFLLVSIFFCDRSMFLVKFCKWLCSLLQFFVVVVAVSLLIFFQFVFVIKASGRMKGLIMRPASSKENQNTAETDGRAP